MIRCVGCMEMHEEELDKCPLCGYSKDEKYDGCFLKQGCELGNGRYLIGNVLGRGGFGVTYLAWDMISEKKVSIKEFFPSDLSSRSEDTESLSVFSGSGENCFREGLARFVDEARRLSKLHKIEGIIEIYDCFEENNTAYIVMEYLQGETLASKLEREGKMDFDFATSMMIPVMKSLIDIHNEGIIHRDISPDNIFVLKNGTAKLIDFGASRMALIDQSKSLTVIVKSGYSPEEQYDAEGNQGTWTDVYAMAATLYRMITGKKPADAISRTSNIRKKGKDSLMTIKECEPMVSDNFSNAIKKAMIVNAEDRTQTMQSFLDDIEGNTTLKNNKLKKCISNKKIIISCAIIICICFIFGITYSMKCYPGKIINTLICEVKNQDMKKQKVNKKDKKEKIEKVLVANVIGLDENDAVEMLEKLGLIVKCTYSVSAEHTNNIVIFQSIEANLEVEQNSEITLEICKNEEENNINNENDSDSTDSGLAQKDSGVDNKVTNKNKNNSGDSSVSESVTVGENKSTQNSYEDFEYVVNGNTVTINRYVGTDNSVVIPTTIAGKNVTTIGTEAFKGNKNITSIIITDNISSISSGAFEACTNLKDITLSANVSSIPDRAFQNCMNIKNIDIPSKVTTIGSSAFESCMAMENVNFPSGLTSIGSSAFANCKALTSLEFPSSITNFGAKAFYGCSSLSTIKVPTFNATLGESAFASTKLSTVNLHYTSPLSYNSFVKAGAGKEININYYGGVNIMPTLKKYFEPYGLINYGTLTCDANDVMTITTNIDDDVHTAGYAREECNIPVEANSEYIFRCDVYENTGNSMEIFVFTDCDAATKSFENAYYDMFYTRVANGEMIRFSTNNTSGYIRIRFDANNAHSILKIKNAKLFKVK